MPLLETPYGITNYHKVGSGPRAIVALHGYGRDGKDFLKAVKQSDKELTLYAIDLPYHGQTAWNTEYYNQTQLREIISLLVAQEDIRQFTAVGHSLGGRLWLVLAPYFAERLKSLWLLAPDGLATRNMSLFEHLPIPVRTTLAAARRYPKTLLSIANVAYQWSIIDARAVRFLKHHLSNEGMMLNLVNTWKSIYHFSVNKKQLKRSLSPQQYPVYFVIGARDQVIDTKKMQSWVDGIGHASFVSMEHSSHQSIISQCMPMIVEKVRKDTL
jgi:pimeloyl-ACP methyl ester carboxylesterase